MIKNEINFEALLDLVKSLNFEVQKIQKKPFKVNLKEDSSPITEADNYVNEKLNDFVKTTSYKNIISEENKSIPFEGRRTWDYYWVIDPIDGTKEFVKGGDDFTINIALCYLNRPIFGLVSVPIKNDIYYAFKKNGAFKNNEKIQTDDNKEFLKIAVSKSHLNESTQNYVNQLKRKEKVKLIGIGSSLKICYLADLKANIYPRFGPTMEWDTCAADIILEEAGGKILSTNNELLSYNKENLLNPNFIAYAKGYLSYKL